MFDAVTLDILRELAGDARSNALPVTEYHVDGGSMDGAIIGFYGHGLPSGWLHEFAIPSLGGAEAGDLREWRVERYRLNDSGRFDFLSERLEVAHV